MENTIVLWHGSDHIIEEPQFGAGRVHNDYGPGFYCTENEALAKEWACSSLKGGYANRYTLDLTDLNILNLNSDAYSILNWIAVLVSHRQFRTRTPIAGRAKRYLEENFYVNVNACDVVIGYRADDSYFDFADAFLNNGITVEQLAQAMALGKPGEQIVLKSRLAFARIAYQGYSSAERTTYYPLREARDREAKEAYDRPADESADGLYLADIIRGGLNKGDDRIPRNISCKRNGSLR